MLLLVCFTSSMVAAQVGTTTTATAAAVAPGPGFLGLALLEAPRGFEITGVVTDGPGARSGLEVGQLVVAVDGATVGTWAGLQTILGHKRAGDRVTLTVRVGDIERTVPVVLAPVPASAAAPAPASRARAGLSLDGSGLSFSERRVTRVAEPPDSAVAVTWSMFFSETVADLSQSSVGGVGLGVRYLDPWGTFPGLGGGATHSLSAELGVLGMFGGIRNEAQQVGIIFLEASSYALGIVRGSVTLGYSFIYFLAGSEDGGSQRGIGLKLGVEGGGSLSITSVGGATQTTVSPVVGPAIALELPSYNPGTAKVTFTSINVVVIPIDGVTFSVGVSGSF